MAAPDPHCRTGTPPEPGPPTLDRRHIIVASAFVLQAVTIGGLFAYGVFFSFLEQELGWSRTLLSACISLCFVVMGVSAIAAGQLADRFGPREVLAVSAVCYGIGYGLMLFLDAPWQLFVLFGVFIGIGLGSHDVVTLSVVARVFLRRRGIMTAVVKVGTACGQIVIPLLATALIATLGWRWACAVLGAGAGVVLLLCAAGVGIRVSARPDPAGITAVGAPEVALASALRSRVLWTLCLVQFSFLPALVTVPVHLPVHARDLGLSTAAAAGLLSMIGAASIVGRLAIGAAADRIGGRRSMLASLVLLGLSLLWLTAIETPWQLYLFAVAYGIAHGGLFTVVSPTVAEYFGLRAMGAIFGVVLFCGTLGAALGPVLAGRVFDTTSSYTPAWAGLVALVALAGALVGSLPRRTVVGSDRLDVPDQIRG